MFVAKVIGTVVSTSKEPNLRGLKLLVVRDINAENPSDSLIAVDAFGAGVGDTVLVVVEGGGARQTIRSDEVPVNAAVAGIVDRFDIV